MAEPETQLDRIEATLWAGQIGEIERIEGRLRDDAKERDGGLIELVDVKLSALKWQGVAALLGGQALAGLISAVVVKTGSTPAPVRAAASAIRNLL